MVRYSAYEYTNAYTFVVFSEMVPDKVRRFYWSFFDSVWVLSGVSIAPITDLSKTVFRQPYVRLNMR